MKNENEEQSLGDTWGEFTGYPFLKVKDMEELKLGDSFPFVVTSVSIKDEDEDTRPVISLTGDYEGITYRHDLNVTNARFIRDTAKVPRPKDLVGKVITFHVEEVLNPKGQKVKGIRIEGVT